MYSEGLLGSLATLRDARSFRASSYDVSGRNTDVWTLKPCETRVLADIKGAGCIRHIWMTQSGGYRGVLLRMFWDDETEPSVLCPLGDFFGLGHEIVSSYQSLLFSASCNVNNKHFGNRGCALNCYAPMPFRKAARIELVNELPKPHNQYFYIDYELYDEAPPSNVAYFHTQWRRENPFGGWGHEIGVNTPESDIVNKERTAWDNNYVILEAKGRGHYIGCNLSVTNLQGSWWGEGDDMIWVDGYKWPPDLHGTGSEDYLNQAWGVQDNAFLRNGSSLHENNTGGCQTSYVHHLENPVHFRKEIKVTIEHGHGNHLRNEMASTAYWYQQEPHLPFGILPAGKRSALIRAREDVDTAAVQHTSREIVPNAEMTQMKDQWRRKQESNP